jgi:hypothetical protein
VRFFGLDGVAGEPSSCNKLKLACKSWPSRFGMNLWMLASINGNFEVLHDSMPMSPKGIFVLNFDDKHPSGPSHIG